MIDDAMTSPLSFAFLMRVAQACVSDIVGLAACGVLAAVLCSRLQGNKHRALVLLGLVMVCLSTLLTMVLTGNVLWSQARGVQLASETWLTRHVFAGRLLSVLLLHGGYALSACTALLAPRAPQRTRHHDASAPDSRAH